MNATKTVILPFILFALSFALSPKAYALSYGSGVYTNICGTGTAATGNTCNRGCNTANGSCSSGGQNVVKFTCDGRQIECRNNESTFSTSQSLSGASCGKTVQIDVFTKNCRVGGWTCSDSDMLDYMVWYSGDCQSNSTPTPTPTPTPIATPTPTPTLTPTPTPTPIQTSSCDTLIVAGGNNAPVPATVTLRARGSDSAGSIQRYRFYYGDGKTEESTNAEIIHRYESSGTFTARADVLDSRGAWKSAGACETTVYVQPSVIESQKSDCSDLFIISGNYNQPPTTGKFQVTGYDNKGSLQRYKIDFGNAIIKESDSGTFEQVYDRAGTYTVSGYIRDSKGNWKGGSGSCQKLFYVSTSPLTRQPSTGTPTMFTIAAILGGTVGFIYLLAQKLASKSHTPKLTPKRKK
jgi:hypothetical protein